jgi:hypothetical protein
MVTPLPLYPRGRSPRYPFDRMLVGEEKVLNPTGTRTPTRRVVQPVASRYTDSAIPASHSTVVLDSNAVMETGCHD